MIRTNLTASWIALLAFALIAASHTEDEYRRQASRLDLKVMTLELKGTSSVIDRMGVFRNETRAKANQWERVVLSLSVAAALGAVAITVTGWMWVALGVVSIGIAARAGWFAMTAMGVI